MKSQEWLRMEKIETDYTDCTKHASAGALIHRQQTIYWSFTQTSIEIHAKS